MTCKIKYIVCKLKNILANSLYVVTWLKWNFLFIFVCLLNVGRSRYIDVTFNICGTRICIWCVLYVLVWCVGGLVGIHLDMALLRIQSTYAHRKQRPLGEIYFSGFFFVIFFFNVFFHIVNCFFGCCIGELP
jgi:hypothetical protein